MNLPTVILPGWLMHFELGSSQLLSDYHCCSGVQSRLSAQHFGLSFSQCHEDDDLVLQPANFTKMSLFPLQHTQYHSGMNNK